jgi:hypothetical protein
MGSGNLATNTANLLFGEGNFYGMLDEIKIYSDY